MRTSRLLIQQLDDEDVDRLFTFLRNAAGRLQTEWVVVDEGEGDVILIGGDEPATVPGLLNEPAVTLRVIPARQMVFGMTGYLVRPLQYEPLIFALENAERQMHREEEVPEVPEPRATVSSHLLSAWFEVRPPMPTPSLSASVDLAPEASFKLKRWPPAAALQANRYCVRLASFLSTRHVQLEELARLSNVTPRQCQGFVAQLLAAGLVDIKRSAPAAGLTSAPPAPAPAPVGRAVTAQPQASVGLLNKVRHRLGLA